MSYTDPVDSKPFEVVPEGKHRCRLVWYIDLGTHEDTYQGEAKLKHTVNLGFELLDKNMSDGRPFMAFYRGTVTNGEWGPFLTKAANLTKLLKKWTGKEDIKLKNLLAMVRDAHPCYVVVEHEKKGDKTYSNIVSVKSGENDFPHPRNEILVFGCDIPKTDPIWQKIPAWAKKKVESCKELNGGLPPKESKSDNYDSDVPF